MRRRRVLSCDRCTTRSRRCAGAVRCRWPMYMRKKTAGLAFLARAVIQHDPLSGAMLAFINARRNKLKILVWERNGVILWYKRLARHRFHWPRVGEAVLTLSGVELNRLLDGYDVWMKPHEALHFSVLG